MAFSGSIIRGPTGALSAGTAGGGSAFNINPSPQTGQGAFGAVPGAVGLPSPFADLSSVYPNLAGTNAAASGDIMSRLKGQLSPDVLQQIQDQAARLGVQNGIPGFQPGSLGANNVLATIGRTSQDLQQQGLQDYNALLPTISSTQTVNPALQAQIAENNSLMQSAPNPQAAASYAQGLFDKYLQQLQSPAGATTSRWDHLDPSLAGVPGSAMYENTLNPRYGGV